MPLAALTAAVGLYARLQISPPWLPQPQGRRVPLLIYGASSAVGCYAVQLAKRSNTHPLICIAGRAKDYLEQFIDPAQGDIILDYRSDDAKLHRNILTALQGENLEMAFDAVSDERSGRITCGVLQAKESKLVQVLPKHLSTANVPEWITTFYSNVVDIHIDLKDFGLVFTRLLAQGLQDGWFKAQPHEVVPGGLSGVENGLRMLKEGKASAVKYVFHIGETPGLER